MRLAFHPSRFFPFRKKARQQVHPHAEARKPVGPAAPHDVIAELEGVVLVAQPETVERDAGEMALRSLSEDGDSRDDVGAGLEVAQLLSVARIRYVPKG